MKLKKKTKSSQYKKLEPNIFYIVAWKMTKIINKLSIFFVDWLINILINWKFHL